MKRSAKTIGVSIFILIVTVTALFGWSGYVQKKAVKETVIKDTVPAIAVDTIKLKMLSTVFEKLYMDQNEFLLSGSIDINNGADTAGNLKQAEYIFSRKGKAFYFKMGHMETINAHGLFLYIDHDTKKVFLTKEKEVIPNAGMPILTQVVKRVKEEGYVLSSLTYGNTEQIILKNPYHLSCKEYRVAFNKNSLKPERLFLRLTDLSDPENSKRDNVIDFKIKQAEPLADIEKYTAQTIIRKEKGSWLLTFGYQDYELINKL